jgi:hypothetical protein
VGGQVGDLERLSLCFMRVRGKYSRIRQQQAIRPFVVPTCLSFKLAFTIGTAVCAVRGTGLIGSVAVAATKNGGSRQTGSALNTQSVPRSKHTQSRLYKPVS